MGKNGLRKFKTVSAPLVLIGWLSFLLGNLVADIPNALKLFLLLVARALP